MRFLRSSIIGLFLASMTLGLLIYAGALISAALDERLSRENRQPPKRERVFSVNVVEAEAQDIRPVLTAYGETAARHRLELRAAVAGRVVMRSPDFVDGGAVSKGDLLLRVDPADLQSSRDRLRAELAEAEAGEREALRSVELAQDELAAAEQQAALQERVFTRQQDLTRRGVGSAAAAENAEISLASSRATVLTRRQSLATAEARVDQAGTALTRARIALADAERDLIDTELRAPFDGILSETSVIEGRLVTVNERLAELVDPSDLEISFVVSTAQFTRLLDERGRLIKAPLTARVDVAGVELEAQGTVTRASVDAGEGQPGRRVFAQLTDATGFRPGDFVTVSIAEPELRNVVRLPAAALASDGTVLALAEDSRLEEIEVQLMRRQGNDVLVRAVGLEGRQIVAERSPLLGPGVSVKPLRRDAPVPTTPEMVELSDERRAKLVAFVEASTRMPEEAKARVLAQLAKPKVSARVVSRIESRMGG